MNPRDVIVIGASAGGLQALRELLRTLPNDLPATIFIVHHIGSAVESTLPQLLQSACQLEVSYPMNGEQFKHSHVYVAPRDRHMLLQDGRIILSDGPKENRSRPAIDPLFRSAAMAFRSRVVGVVLTGELDDGTAGLWSVKYRGGITVVQDPTEASSASMPRSALKHVHIDHRLPIAEIGLLVTQLIKEPVGDNKDTGLAQDLEIENRIAMNDHEAIRNIDNLGKLTHFTCPECHGLLRELRNGTFIRFRCRSGHANSAENLIAEQAQITENFLRAALRETEENPHLGQYLSEHSRREGDQRTAEFFLAQTAENERRAHLIHDALKKQETPEIGRLWEAEGCDLETQRVLLQIAG